MGRRVLMALGLTACASGPVRPLPELVHVACVEDGTTSCGRDREVVAVERVRPPESSERVRDPDPPDPPPDPQPHKHPGPQRGEALLPARTSDLAPGHGGRR